MKSVRNHVLSAILSHHGVFGSLLGLGLPLVAGCAVGNDLAEDSVTDVAATSAALTGAIGSQGTSSIEQSSLRAAIDHLRANGTGIGGNFAPSFVDQVDAALSAGDWTELASQDGPIDLVNGRPIQFASNFVSMSELGTMLRSSKDPGNMSRYYRLAYRIAPAQVQAKYSTPEALANLDSASLGIALDSLLTELANQSASYLNGFQLFSPPSAADCAAEAGYRMGLDGVITRSTYAPKGIMGNVSFALHNDLTCVRDQARRGTCYAFAIAAAIETAVHVENGNKINLSEQHATWKGQTTTGFAHRYTYGVDVAQFLEDIMSSGYQIPKEKMWPYNPSLNRSDDKVGKVYPFSCTDYPWTCTDYAFQTEENVDPTYTYPDPVPNAGAFGVSSVTQLTQDDLGLAIAKKLLEQKVPLVWAFDVTANFKKPDANGYIKYDSADLPNGHGHAVLMAGWVPNGDLPAGAPAGSGGGYYLLKNSWGDDFGDAGYAYAPYDYVLANGRSLTAVEVF